MGKNKEYYKTLILGLLLSAIIATIFFYLKRTFEYDESFSIALSNWFKGEYAGWFTYDEHGWYEREFFNDPYIIDSTEAFKYSAVNNNQFWDCHPPLFYWLIHTISSILQGRFSVWIGFVVNFPFFILNCYLIYKIIFEKTLSLKTSFLGMLTYSFSGVVLSSFVFIRMYQMASTFSLLYFYYALRIVDNSKNKYVNYLAIFVTTILGGLTHYYFYIAALSVSLFAAIWLIIKKKFNVLMCSFFSFVSAMFLNIFVIFKGTIHHLMWSHGESTFDKLLHISIDFNRYREFILQSWGGGIIFVLGIALIVYSLFNIKKNKQLVYPLVFLASYYIYFVFIGYTATYVTYRYIIPVVTYLVIGFSLGLYYLVKKELIVSLMLSLLVLCSFNYSYLSNFNTIPSWKYAASHQDDIAIVIKDERTTYNEIQSSLFADLRWYIATLITDLEDGYVYDAERDFVLYLNNQENIESIVETLKIGNKYNIEDTGIETSMFHVYHVNLLTE